MRHYATLFDAKYLPQGLALYESLMKHSSERFALWIMAMDRECSAVLRALSLPNVRVMDLVWFEAAAKFTRIPLKQTWQEYCWACGSVMTDYLMHVYQQDTPADEDFEGFTYLDADCYFFSDPSVIFDEIADRSIAVIPHRLAENDQKERLSKNGLFNVSLVYFKNNNVGRECLSTWAVQVRERCSADVGCGDQLYLDEWPAKYGDELAVIQNHGAGIAPWNLPNYGITPNGAGGFLLMVPDPPGTHRIAHSVEPVFYHFHELRKNDDGTFRLTNYELRDDDRKYIYGPYLAAYKRAEQLIASTISVQA